MREQRATTVHQPDPSGSDSFDNHVPWSLRAGPGPSGLPCSAVARVWRILAHPSRH
jgi:hypothetical protein